MMKHTLQLTTPFGRTLILMIPLLCVLLIAGEVIIRQPLIYSRLKTPSLNSRHYHIERQWYRLEDLTRNGIEIDCIALGNSMVVNSFDPILFNQSFQSETGIDLNCFNFGVDALTPVSAAYLAQILIDTHHPKLLIFGTDARDFAIDRQSEETTVIADMAWVKYRLGKFSLAGWLVDHSYLYRYRYSLVEFMQLQKRWEEPVTNLYGSEPSDIIATVSAPPDRGDDSYHIQYYYRVLENYSVKPENRAALNQILDLKSSGTAIALIEMPVPDTYFYFFDNPAKDYQAFLDTLATASSDNDVFFLETTRHHLIPDDGWVDYTHVNRQGAHIFSEWLGKQLGNAVIQGQITGLTP
jgi:hypothetical protein